MKKISFSLWPWLIILAGILYSLYLLAQIPPGVYFSGDGGLKAILARQLSQGDFRFDLATPDIEWVHQLWQDGLYPYEPPFVYYLAEKYYISFPFTFSLVTAPFYALFGETGLYIIPLVSMWAIWLMAYGGCRILKLENWATSLTLFALIFASNLTLYGAMYWEHGLAVALGLGGLIILILPEKKINISKSRAVLSGFLVGLSAWARSEFLAMLPTLFIIIYLPVIGDLFNSYIFKNKFSLNWDNWIKRNREIFLGSMGLTVFIFFTCNKLIYGRWLGIHAMLITEDFSLGRRLAEAWSSFQEIVFTLFEYFPLAFFPLLYLSLFLLIFLREKLGIKSLIAGLIVIFILLLGYGLLTPNLSSLPALRIAIRQAIIPVILLSSWLYFLKDFSAKLTTRMTIVYLICFLFIGGVALLVDITEGEIAVGGKQWGNRYLLILIPLLAWIAVIQFRFLQNSFSALHKYVSIGMISLLLILGVYKNMYLGTGFFQRSHQGVAETLDFLRQNPQSFVAVSHQYAAQMLEPSLLNEKIFFLADTSPDLLKLGAALLAQNENQFIYVCYPFRQCQPVEEQKEDSSKLKFSKNSEIFQITLSELGKKGRYPVYQATIDQIEL